MHQACNPGLPLFGSNCSPNFFVSRVLAPAPGSEAKIPEELAQAMLGPDGRLSPASERLLAENIEVATTAPAAANRAHAIALLTEWDELRSLDFPAVYQQMHKPAFLFDGRNLLKSYQLHKHGFRYHAIGSDKINKPI